MKLDLDNSGSLSVDEFMSLPELQQNPLVQRVIEIFDEDGNGEVDFKEFIQGVSQFSVKGDKESKMRFAFRIYDMDNDGFISNGELFQVLKMMVGNNLKDTQLQQIVDKTVLFADKDEDGKISFEEFCAVVGNTDVHKKMVVDETHLNVENGKPPAAHNRQGPQRILCFLRLAGSPEQLHGEVRGVRRGVFKLRLHHPTAGRNDRNRVSAEERGRHQSSRFRLRHRPGRRCHGDPGFQGRSSRVGRKRWHAEGGPQKGYLPEPEGENSSSRSEAGLRRLLVRRSFQLRRVRRRSAPTRSDPRAFEGRQARRSCRHNYQVQRSAHGVPEKV